MTPDPQDSRAGAEMLARSTDALRENHDAGWDEASQRVLAAVRGATRRSWPVDATFPAAEGAPDPSRAREGDRLSVSDQVVISFVRRALDAIDSCAPSRITLHLDDHECTGATVSVVAAYGTDLREAADRARQVVLATLEDVLGPPTFEQRTAAVDISVDDITLGDPRS